MKKLEYKVIEKEIAPKILKRIGIYVSYKAKELCPKMIGTLRDSIGYQIVGNSVFIGTNLEPYASVMEYGRKPNKWPNIEAIKKWVIFRGMGEKATFPVARAIKERGIKVGTAMAPLRTPSGFRPYLRPSVFQSRPRITEFIKEGFGGK